MKKVISIALLVFILVSCKKEKVLVSNQVTIKANNTTLVSARGLDGTTLDNRVNLLGANSITVSTSNNPLECYFSVEDPLKNGVGRTIIKTDPPPTFTWNATSQKMELSYTLNVSIIASGRDYIGHIVINGNSSGMNQQTDYLIRR
jgi:hypothetical protein